MKSEKNNLGEFMQMEKIICDFCEVLTDDDKYMIFSEIKFIFEDSIFNQKNTFKEIFSIAVKHADKIPAVTVWGTNDSISWRRNQNPLLFSGGYQPKKAYYAVMEVAKSG